MRKAADRLGVSVATVCYQAAYIRRLPEAFVTWLESDMSDPFHAILLEQRLREIVRLRGEVQIDAILDVLLDCKATASDSQKTVLQELEDSLTN